MGACHQRALGRRYRRLPPEMMHLCSMHGLGVVLLQGIMLKLYSFCITI